MRTPSLARRVVVVGVGVVALLTLGLDVLLYLSVRSVAADRTHAVLESQTTLIDAVVRTENPAPSPEDLVGRLSGLGVEATVQAGDGPVLRSRPARTEEPSRLVSRKIPVPHGLKVTLFVPSPDDDPQLRRLLKFEVIITPLLIALAALLLQWIAEVAMAPLEEIAAAARRTTLGQLGERLRADRPDTRLGQIAVAYDEMLDALEGAVAEARAAETRTRRFLDDAAHQLRTPITSIRAGAETLQRNVTPGQRDHLLAAVVRDSERAGRLMAGLLRLARLGHPQALEVRPTDLVALCEEEADQARPDSPHLKITARAAEGPALGRPEVAADTVSEILANLVDNSRRHARSHIEIVVDRDDQWVRIRVLDDGPGLPEGQAEVAFDRFVSLDAQGGSGLGLAIARELARAQGGDLIYEAGEFMVTLPWRPGAVPDGPRRHPDYTSSTEQSFQL
ncbi:MAG TPA: HAMP domain-containing sensor histidine kinase [Acidimicrobiales bacterium]|nr:HAMP domain-containing sensor histidine kinase [Acidimicrobiales bacterium]